MALGLALATAACIGPSAAPAGTSGAGPISVTSSPAPTSQAPAAASAASRPTSTPAVTTSPTTGVAIDRNYGLLIRRSDGRSLVVRDYDGAVVSSVNESTLVYAVSRDGREVAYFPGTELRELWIAPVRDLGDRRKLAALSDERGIGLVWAPDGSSLMFAAASAALGPDPEPAPQYTALRVIGRDGSGLHELARIATGQHVRPVAWDPARQLGAAVEGLGQKGPGRYVIVSARPGSGGSVGFMDLPGARENNVGIEGLQASSDARFAMAIWRTVGAADVIRYWPLAALDPGRMRELMPQPAGEMIRGASWRPKSLEIGVNLGGKFQLWTLDGQRRPVRDIGSSVYFSFRHDGSSLYSASGPGEEIEIADLTDRTTTPHRLPGGGIGVSVDLTGP